MLRGAGAKVAVSAAGAGFAHKSILKVGLRILIAALYSPVWISYHFDRDTPLFYMHTTRFDVNHQIHNTDQSTKRQHMLYLYSRKAGDVRETG